MEGGERECGGGERECGGGGGEVVNVKSFTPKGAFTVIK